jgi:hypothetical protein
MCGDAGATSEADLYRIALWRLEIRSRLTKPTKLESAPCQRHLLLES